MSPINREEGDKEECNTDDPETPPPTSIVGDMGSCAFFLFFLAVFIRFIENALD